MLKKKQKNVGSNFVPVGLDFPPKFESGYQKRKKKRLKN